jgi:hypothetical protein
MIGEIARAAWVDVALWDHATLYLALVSTHPYLREIMPALAWTYVFCRSRRDFALYLYLRFGSILSDQERSVQHAELHLSLNSQRQLKGLTHQKGSFPRITHSIVMSAFEAIENGRLLFAAPITTIYSESPDAPHSMGTHANLSFAHGEVITDLRVVNTYFHAEQHAQNRLCPSVTRLTILHAKDKLLNWAETPRSFRQRASSLATPARGSRGACA